MAYPIRTRNVLTALAAAVMLAACGGDGTSATSAGSSTDARTSYERPNDHAMGSVDAPVVITEYASVTCPACVSWHNTVFPQLKSEYIDTGKVRFVFREFLTGQPELAEVGFKIALCADQDDYFKNLKMQFERFPQIMQQVQQGKAREAYLKVARDSGLSEEEFKTCLADPAKRQQILDTQQYGYDEGVDGTPAFFINGERKRISTFEDFEKVIKPLLGEPVEAEETAEGDN